jgi:hypothetical protein
MGLLTPYPFGLLTGCKEDGRCLDICPVAVAAPSVAAVGLRRLADYLVAGKGSKTQKRQRMG